MRHFTFHFRRFGFIAALILLTLLLLQSTGFAQQTGTITGTVFDVTGAVIPGAKVTLASEATGDTRSSVSNGEGYFTFPGVVPGDYTIRAEAKSFSTFEVKGIHILPGDKQYVSGIKLTVGNQSETVTVEARASAAVTVDSPERSATITSSDIKRLGTNGRNATELLKILPGFTIRGANKVNNVPGYDPNVQSISNSATGAYGANGMAPQTGGVSLTSDGAQIIDPGDMGASVATVNMDMVEEVKVQTSNFGADVAKGPVVINAVGKSGTQNFHGSLYMYARDGSLNAEDAYLKSNHQTKPYDRYLYPGANIGGPVDIPGTNLKNKMFFFSGFEYYKQSIPYNSPISAQVPTLGMRSGDFSWNGVKDICAGQMPTGWQPGVNWTDQNGNVHPQTIDNEGNGPMYCVTPTYAMDPVTNTAARIVGGQIPDQFKSGAAQAYFKLFPQPNATPTSANGWANYIYEPVLQENSWQLHNRLDYNFNENNKLYGTYNLQKETDPQTQAIYWAPGNAIAFPGGVQQQIKSNTFSLNYLRVIGPTLTNEAKANLMLYNGPFSMTNPGAVSRSGLGYDATGVFNNGNDQIPDLINWWPGGFPMVYMQGGFDNGPMVSRKTSYNFQDDLTKVFRTHTVKAGFYYERTANAQWLSANTNGTFNNSGDTWRYIWSGPVGNLAGWYGNCDEGGPGPNCWNNVADLYMGLLPTYSQDQKALEGDMYFKTVSFYATDTWKLSQRLTLDFGARFEYVGPWTDAHGIGFAVFDPSLYSQQASQVASGGWYTTNSSVQYPGMTWHASDPSIPLSGAPNHAPFVSPRFGLAWDVFGNGKTMVRGGWGMYRWHDAYNPYAGALNPGLGQKSVNISGAYSIASIDTMASQLQTGQNFADPSAYFVDKNDIQQPLTTNWNLTIDRQLPWSSVLEVGYVGNNSEHMIPPGQLTSINVMPIGALYTKTMPAMGNTTPEVSNYSTNQMDQFRPYSWYSETLQGTTHNSYANYHALQVTWNRQKGWATYGLNYTFSKALGIFTDTNPLNMRDDYGPLNFDRTHAFNATYSFDLGNRYHGNSFLGGVLNNWMFSGVTSYQSGFSTQSANDSNSTGYGFGGAQILNPYYDPSAPAGTPNSTLYTVDFNNSNFLGTPDVTLQPYTVCNPTTGTPGVSNSYMNTSCYAVPQFLQNGPVYKGYYHSPGYFDSDITVSKTFKTGEKKSLQFRASAFNFLNHPLLSFNESNKNNLSLSLSNSTINSYCPVRPGVGSDGQPYSAAYNCFTPGQTLIPMDFTQNQSAKSEGYVGQAITKFGRRTIMLGVKFEF